MAHGYGVCARCATVVWKCRCWHTEVNIQAGPCFVCERLTDEQAADLKVRQEGMDVGYRYIHPLPEARAGEGRPAGKGEGTT